MKVNYSRLILLCFSVLILAYLLPYLFLDIPSSDLGSHTRVVDRAYSSLARGQLFFYDTNWFAGWPVFSFYGFFPHLAAVAVSFVLSAWLPEIVACTYAVRALSLFMCLLLPFSLRFCVQQFLPRPLEHAHVLSLICGALSVFFLHNDSEFHGVGFGAIFHIGLFAQGFGWNLLLVHIGLLEQSRKNASPRNFYLLCLCFTLLLSSHPLTSVFAAVWSFVWLLFYPRSRSGILSSHLIAFGLLSFWLVPFALYGPEFSSGDKYPSVGSIDQLYGPVFYALLIVFALGIYDSWRARRLERILLLAVLFSVDALIQYHPLLLAVPLGIHFYRIQGFIVLVSLVPIAIFLYRGLSMVAFRKYLASGFALASIAILFIYPTASSQRAIATYQSQEYSELDEVILALGASGRVFFEYDSDYEKTPFLSAHYLSANFEGETLNGLFIESAPSNRFVSVTADTLGAGTYHNYFVFLRDAEISPWIAFRQLQDMGVEYVVAHSDAFREALLAHEKVFESSGSKYSIYRLPQATPVLSSIEKKVVAYLDLDGGLPFSFVSYYFYSKEKLYSTHELIQLKPGEDWPQGIDVLLANGSREELLKLVPIAKRRNILLLPFFLTTRVSISPLNLNVPVDDKIERYHALEAFFSKKYQLEARLNLDLSELPMYDVLPVDIHISRGSQALRFEGYQPDQIIRLNYNYHPYWKAEGGKVFRGTAEKMIVFPDPNSKAVLMTYSYWNAEHSKFAVGFSILSLLLLLFLPRRFLMSEAL
jgi:hypothetical protein